jgi:hypothetical protein
MQVMEIKEASVAVRPEFTAKMPKAKETLS